MINYQVKYSSRKTLGITVERDSRIVVHAPKNLPIEKIENIVQSKSNWINRKLLKSKKYTPTTVQKEFVSGESLMYLGHSYNLFVCDEIFDGIVFDKNFRISKQNHSDAEKLFKEWYKNQAMIMLQQLAKNYSEKLGVKYNQLKLSEMKYRWGSCTPKGNININWRIIKAPIYVVEYLVVHELAHLLEPNHSENFWNIVSVQIPNYEEAKNWLKQNGSLLEIDF